MSDANIRHALDTAEQQPTTARKIAAFLHCMPGPYSRWWHQIPPHVETLSWLACAVERDAKIDPLVGLLSAEDKAALSAIRAEKAEGGGHD